MKSKTRMRQFKTPTRMAKIKILTITYNVNRCEKEQISIYTYTTESLCYTPETL